MRFAPEAGKNAKKTISWDVFCVAEAKNKTLNHLKLRKLTRSISHKP